MPLTITNSASTTIYVVPFPLELEDSNVVESNDAGEGGIGDSKRGVPVDTWIAEEKIMVRI